MRITSGAFVVILLAFCSGSSSLAQDLTLKDRSVIELNMGFWGGSSVSNTIGVSGIRANANTSSFVGSFLYAYGLREELAVTLSVGMLSAGASANIGTLGVSQQAGTVVPLLLGMRYYVPSPEAGAKVRPFLSFGIGSYFGMESNNSVGLTLVQESHSETAFGGRIGAGIDFYVGNYFKFVVNAGYNLMTDFSAPVTGRTNYNGGDFSIGAGFAF
jgi:Outer membrane protein beta-barrel domain